MTRSLPRLAISLAIAAAFAVSACTSVGAPSPTPTTPGPPIYPGWPPDTIYELIPVPVSSDVAVGQNRFLINLIDARNQQLASPDRAVELRFYDLARDAAQPAVSVPATYTPTIEGRPGLYRAQVEFDAAGDWGVEVNATEADGSQRVGRMIFSVRETSTTPQIGAQAPASDTPTATTPDAIAAISTDDEPDPDFYVQSVAGAVEAAEPFMVIFATPAFCTSATCGPTLDVVKSIAPDFKDRVTFIHVEPYELAVVDGRLQPVLSDQNLPIPVAAVNEWGLPSEPYIFVVDAEGKVTAKFEGVAAPDELRAALELAANPAL